MTLKQIGDEANKIENEIGLTLDDLLNKLTQELGEFNDAVQKYRGRYCRVAAENTKNIEGEVADLLFNIISIYNRLGLNPNDLPALAESNIKKFQERKELYINSLKNEREF